MRLIHLPLVVLGLAAWLPAERVRPPQPPVSVGSRPDLSGEKTPLRRYEFDHRQMGTLFRIVLYAADSGRAGQAAAAAFRRVDELNGILSDYQADSELNRLSATAGTGRVVPVSRDLWRVLDVSERAARQTGGAFDATVGPLVSLWRRAVRQQALPAAEALAKARQVVGYQYLQMNRQRQTVELRQPGMRLDVGGLGKGFAGGEALAVLRRTGIRSALVDGGGKIVAGAAPPGKRGWQVEVRLGTGNTVSLALAHASVSTSGDLYQHLELDGKRYSHVLDPRTGLGLTDQSRVAVVAPDGITADWLSTAVSVLGPEEGLRLVEKTPGAAVVFVRMAGEKTVRWESRRWRKWEVEE
ncbi:MAG: FAD:protein FMN transferase [Ferruginibacter sp.]|nr:FAD:protein FMN transferase [Cytophagales bacterium]